MTGIFLPHLLHGQDDKKVVVGIAPLQETLATADIAHQPRGVAPSGIGGTHVDRGVELPSRPRHVARTVGRTMEEHVVDTAGEHQVEVGLHLAQ